MKTVCLFGKFVYASCNKSWCVCHCYSTNSISACILQHCHQPRHPSSFTRFITSFRNDSSSDLITERKLSPLIYSSGMETQPDVDTEKKAYNCLTVACYPIKTSGPPSIFTDLCFEKVPIKPNTQTEGSQKKRKLIQTDAQQTDTATEESKPTKQRRLVLGQNLLQKVSEYVKHNADKVPLPECDACSDNVFPDVHHRLPKSGLLASTSGDNTSIIANPGDDDGDEDFIQLPLPSPTDDCLQHQWDDVYDISPLFCGNWIDYEVKSKKKKRQILSNKEKDQGSGAGKKQPNYFLAIQVKNPQIHQAIALVQDHIKEQEPLLSPAMIPLSTLHFTLMVLYLDEEDKPRAKQALTACGEKLKHLTSDPLVLTISGIGNFRNNVVFAKVKEGKSHERLQEVASSVCGCFAEHDLSPTDKKGFQAHLTILKLSRSPKLHRKGIRKIEPSLYEELTDTTFGKQTVTGLQLCSMFLPKDAQGYYHVEQELQFVPETYEEADTMFSDQSKSPEAVASRRIVTEAVYSAVHKLREEALRKSRARKLSAKSTAKAKSALKNALKTLENDGQQKIPVGGDDDGEYIKPKLFIAELEKELAWKFEVGEDPSEEYIVNKLKCSKSKHKN